jgi:Domain of unknown function (DUF4148)
MKPAIRSARRFVGGMLAVAALGATLNAFAQDTSPAGKSRAQVRQELIQAEADGVLPNSRNDYPPSTEAIARNRVLYQIRTQGTYASGTPTSASN